MPQKTFVNPEKLSHVTLFISDISPDPSFTMMVLTKVFTHVNSSGVSFTGIEKTISKELRCDISTVKKALIDLVKAGALESYGTSTFQTNSELVRFHPLS